MPRRWRLNKQKLKELVLYVADKSMGDPNFGATKLNKILSFCDFIAYGRLGQPITRARYVHRQYGPAPRQILDIVRELRKEKAVQSVQRDHYGHFQTRLVPLRDAHLSSFSAEEIAIVDEVLERLQFTTATRISDLSHQAFIGWQKTEDGEEIPYESIFVSTDKPTPTDIKRAKEVERELARLEAV